MVSPADPPDLKGLDLEAWIDTNPLWPYDLDGDATASDHLAWSQHRRVGTRTRSAARHLAHERESHDTT